MSMDYYCQTCDKSVDQEICPTCGTPTQQVSGKARPAPRKAIPLPAAGGSPPKQETEPTAAATDARPGPEPARGPQASSGEPERASPDAASSRPRPVPSSGPSPRSPEPSPLATPGRFAGEEELESYIAEGYEVFLIAGIGGAGKSELLASFRQDGFLDRFKKAGGMVLSTIPRMLNCHPVSLGTRKALFVDGSGENFRTLYPQMRQTGKITEADASFLKVIARGLRGVILLIELERLWANRNQDPADEQQVEILAWILSLLRWMTSGAQFAEGPRDFQDIVDSSVMRSKKRLKIPVQVLFSKADQLADFQVPQQNTSFLRKGSAPVRKLYPVGEDPLLVAYHLLPALYKTVRTHADHFRFDFAHSLITDSGSGVITDPNACGVKLALEWLLDPCWRSRWPIIPARNWVDWQQSIDSLLGRGRRWERLPDPVEVHA